MDVREKLVELIGSTEYGNGSLVGNNFQKGPYNKGPRYIYNPGGSRNRPVFSECRTWPASGCQRPADAYFLQSRVQVSGGEYSSEKVRNGHSPHLQGFHQGVSRREECGTEDMQR